jgi:hypothetical protein
MSAHTELCCPRARKITLRAGEEVLLFLVSATAEN